MESEVELHGLNQLHHQRRRHLRGRNDWDCVREALRNEMILYCYLACILFRVPFAQSLFPSNLLLAGAPIGDEALRYDGNDVSYEEVVRLRLLDRNHPNYE